MCGCGPAAMSAGVNAKPRRWSRSPAFVSSDVPWRLPAGRCIGPRRSRWTSPPTSRASPPASTMTAWICCRRRIRSPASRPRCGTCLGKAKGEPVYRLLGYQKATQETPYASQLFGDTPAADAGRARNARAKRISRRQIWLGPVTAGRAREDADHLAAAREGLGADGILLIDAGQIWGEDVARRPNGCRRSKGRRAVARGAVPCQRARGLWRARRAQSEGEDGRRRGLPFITHGAAT